MTKELKILILEDVPTDAELIERELRKAKIIFSSMRVETRKGFIKGIKDFVPDLILADYKLPSFDGLTALEIAKGKCPDVPFILISGTIGEDIAIETLKKGATDYVLKNRLSRLAPSVNRALREVEERAERIQAEEALRTSEKRFRELFDEAPVGYHEIDKEGKIIRVNRTELDMLEYTAEEMVGQYVYEFITEEISAQSLKGKLAGGLPIGAPFERTYLRKDGTTFPVLIEEKLIKNSEGRIVGLRATIQDITERKRAEEKLNEANVGLQMLQQITASVHSTLDLEEVFRQIADNFVNSMGYNSAIIIKRNDKKDRFEVKTVSSKKWIITEVDRILGFTLKNYSFPVDPVLNATVSAVMRGEIVVAKTAAEVIYPLISKTKCSILQKLGGIKNYIVVPLQADKEIVGGVIITSPREEVDKEELKMVKIFAKAGSNAIQNANLLKLTQQAEETLRESEERFRLAFENANIGMCLVDLEGQLTKVNQKMCEIFGYSKEELEGMTVNDIAHPEDTNISPTFMHRAVSGEVEHANFEKRYLHKEGHIVWGQVSSSLVRNAQGKPQYFISHVEDITERKRTEEALRESEDRYRDLVEHNHDLLCTHDLEGKLLSVNPAVLRVGGYSKDEVLHMNLKDFLASEVRGQFGDYLTEIQTKGAASGVMLVQTKVGEKRLWEYHNTLRTEGVSTPIVRGMARDITERKLLEEKIQHAKKEWENTFDAMNDWISLVDLDGRIHRSNRIGEKFVGKSLVDIVGQNICKLVHNSEEHISGCPMEEMFKTHNPVTVELEVPISDRWFMISVDPIMDADGKILKAVHTVHDITERKRIEEALQESEDRYRDLVEHSQDLICTHDLQGRFLSVNPAVAKFLGHDRSTLMNMNVRDILAPEVRDQFNSYLDKIRRDEDAKGLMLVQTATGEKRILEYTNTLRTQGVDRPIVRSINRDVTERIRAEKALRESEKQYRLLAENVTDIIWTMDMNLQFTYVTPSVTRIRGYSVEEAMSQNMEETLIPSSLDVALKVFAEELEKEKLDHKDLSRSRSLELEETCKDGSTIWTESTVTFLRESEGRPVGILGVTREITERQRAEEEIRKYKDHLEELVKERTEKLQKEIEERKYMEEQLRQRTEELETFNQAMVGREMRIIEMKDEVNELCKKLGIEPKYPPI